MWLKAQKLAPLTPMRQKHPVTHLRANVVMTRTVAVVTVIAIAIVTRHRGSRLEARPRNADIGQRTSEFGHGFSWDAPNF